MLIKLPINWIIKSKCQRNTPKWNQSWRPPYHFSAWWRTRSAGRRPASPPPSSGSSPRRSAAVREKKKWFFVSFLFPFLLAFCFLPFNLRMYRHDHEYDRKHHSAWIHTFFPLLLFRLGILDLEKNIYSPFLQPIFTEKNNLLEVMKRETVKGQTTVPVQWLEQIMNQRIR